MREQQQQALSIEQEIAGYRKDVVREAVRGEQLSGVLRKVEADTQFVVKQVKQGTQGRRGGGVLSAAAGAWVCFANVWMCSSECLNVWMRACGCACVRV